MAYATKTILTYMSSEILNSVDADLRLIVDNKFASVDKNIPDIVK